MNHFKILVGLTLAAAATPAAATEIFGGLYVHDVKTPLNLSGVEDGVDVQLGWRGGRILGTPLQPYVFGAANTSGETHYGAVGVSAKFGDAIFIRPGIGLALHSGSAADHELRRGDRIAFGSRILFEPELGVGAKLSDRLTVEASWIHMSHGTLFGGQNPGIDNLGMRLTVNLP